MVILEIKRVKARKQHRCDMCGKVIEIGKEKTIKQIANKEFTSGNITKECYNAMLKYEVEITD